jgi:hypothetical protein
MSCRSWARILPVCAFLLACCGCGEETSEKSRASSKPKPAQDAPQQPAEGKRVPVGQNVFLEVMPDNTRRVLISSRVCLRQGPLELLLTRRGQKEHEAILTADIDARKVHEALLLANATPGSTVRFEPRFRPPTGTRIKISLIYEEGNRKVMVPARSWVRSIKTGQELDSDWVFAGSLLVENSDPLNPKAPKKYLANDGDVICVANFETALLDLPIRSSKEDADRGFEAWTERIPKAPPMSPDAKPGDPPPEEPPVLVVLEPVLRKKK